MTRAELNRLLRYFTKIERNARSARQLLQAALVKGDEPLPRTMPQTRHIIIEVLQAANTSGRSGLSRAEILGAIRDGYGVAMSSNTATVTLNRMQRAGVIQLSGRKSWSLSG